MTNFIEKKKKKKEKDNQKDMAQRKSTFLSYLFMTGAYFLIIDQNFIRRKLL